jgi:hypothetical protein
MTVSRTDAIATTVVVVFTVFLLELCKMLIQKAIDLKYDWASDGSFYLNLILLAQIGIAAVVPIAWFTTLRNKARVVQTTQ